MITRLPPQLTRRRNIALLYVLYPLGSAALHLAIGPTRWFAIAHLVFTAVLASVLAVPHVLLVGRAIADDVDTRLDERQLGLRNAAYLDAYRVIATSMLLGIIWIALGVDKSIWWIPATYNEWNMVFWGAAVMTMTLPSAFLAWREPDRGDDRDEAELAHA
ncbi:MAG TPA: hypothetical protein VE861_02050 [Gemmatimonadaceae bacterium]|nr:hypothetical protein [Gemmatimonadaceae bacterium]